MSWCVQHRDARVAQFYLLAVPHGHERNAHVGGFMQAVWRPGTPSQLETSRAVIRMHVGIDHVSDSHLLRAGKRDVAVHIFGARIDNGTRPERTAPEQIGGASEVVVVERTENHDAAS